MRSIRSTYLVLDITWYTNGGAIIFLKSVPAFTKSIWFSCCNPNICCISFLYVPNINVRYSSSLSIHFLFPSYITTKRQTGKVTIYEIYWRIAESCCLGHSMARSWYFGYEEEGKTPLELRDLRQKLNTHTYATAETRFPWYFSFTVWIK